MRWLPRSRSSQVMLAITQLLRIILIIAGLETIITQNWILLFGILGTLTLTFMPAVLSRRLKIHLPLPFELATVAFICAAIFLGEIGDYYGKYWWWDSVLHACSAFAFGFIGFLIMYLMIEHGRLKASPFLIAVFTCAFGFSIGAFWEIFEYSVDTVFTNANMQKSGLDDTMKDLIVDLIGAAIASVCGYLYLKQRAKRPFGAFLKWFLDDNPHLRFDKGKQVAKVPRIV